jgi:hypothetical protein
MTCTELGQWIRDNVERPLEQWYARARQDCTEARRWLEERRTEIEEWRQAQETRCREQACNWWCLCCNKWFCWLVDILVRILTVLIQVIEHVVEAVCTLIVTILFLVIMILVQVLKWTVLAVVCLLEATCPLLILLGALALLLALLAAAALPVPALAAPAAAVIGPAAVAAATALGLSRLLCEVGRCRVLGAIGWALKWAIVLGAVLAISWASPFTALAIAIYGGLLAALIVALERGPCRLPSMLGLP